MPVLAVIPARLGSTRLPHKPLQLLAGVPLVVRVAEGVGAIGLADHVVVATDSERIAKVVRDAGFEAQMTSLAHRTGTDRVAEVAASRVHDGFDIVLNIQGDEPFVSAEIVAGALDRVQAGDDIGTSASPLTRDLAGDPSIVKVVMDRRGRALYFSRSAIPFRRGEEDSAQEQYWRHHGVYACGLDVLVRWAALPRTGLETAEGLEQLRALEHGMVIGVARLQGATPPGIDTENDLERAEAIWALTHEET
jgi:3-deoxy-manno-octulosonate cytidylyltransferase (CMP-KDO synthetase)